MLVVPFVSAAVSSDILSASPDPNSADRPEATASLKNHVAYVCELQDARMGGVIRYIGNISNGNGTTALEQMRDDYLVAASSIPLLQTNAEIVKARDSLRTYTSKFSEEAKARVAQYNGNNEALLIYTRAAVNGADASILRSNGTLWLASPSARMAVFNQDSMKRTQQIGFLANRSIDTKKIQNLSEQIDAKRPALEKALATKSPTLMKTTNEEIRVLTREYRSTVEAARAAWAFQTKLDAMMAMG